MSTSDSPVLDGLDRRFPTDPSAVTAARRVLQEWLRDGGHNDRVDDILLVATELAANAVRSGASSFRLRAWREATGLAIEVADDGPGFEAAPPPLRQTPAVDAENGRGLFLVRTLVDGCTIFTADTGTIVRCRITL